MNASLEDKLRAWARGLYPNEAAVELLIRSGKVVYSGAPWLEEGDDRAIVDVDRLSSGVGALSSGERALVAIAVSLLSHDPVDLREAIASLDRGNLDAVLAAIAHAGGSHQHSEIVQSADRGTAEVVTLSSLHPWPA